MLYSHGSWEPWEALEQGSRAGVLGALILPSWDRVQTWGQGADLGTGRLRLPRARSVVRAKCVLGISADIRATFAPGWSKTGVLHH